MPQDVQTSLEQLFNHQLLPPAPSAAIAEAARVFGELPAQLRTLWKQTAGSKERCEEWIRLLGPLEALEVWRAQCGYAEEEVARGSDPANVIFDPRWIPFATDGETWPDYDHIFCLDVRSGSEELPVLQVHHLEGLVAREADSLEAFFGGIARSARAREAAAMAKAEARRSKESQLRREVDERIGQFLEAGVDIGPAGDLVEEPAYVHGEWTAATHCLWLFQKRVAHLTFRGVGVHRWKERVRESVAAWPEGPKTLAPIEAVVKSVTKAEGTQVVLADRVAHEVNRQLGLAESPRQLWPLAGKEQAFQTFYALLTAQQQSRLQGAGLVAFRELSQPPSGLLRRIRDWFK